MSLYPQHYYYYEHHTLLSLQFLQLVFDAPTRAFKLIETIPDFVLRWKQRRRATCILMICIGVVLAKSIDQLWGRPALVV